MTALLDTHVLIWWLNDSTRLSPAQQEVVAAASAESPLLVSDISLWEVATLHSRGRIQLTIPLRAWLDKAVAPRSSFGSRMRLNAALANTNSPSTLASLRSRGSQVRILPGAPVSERIR